MRSQASKSSPKKEVLSKKTLKTSTVTKQIKRKTVSDKKIKNLANKPLTKNLKKSFSDEDTTTKNEGEPSLGGKNQTETAKCETSKINPSDSPSKKSKKKKDSPKTKGKLTVVKKVLSKKSPKTIIKRKTALKSNLTNDEQDNDDVKYKINLDAIKKQNVRPSKANIIKKGISATQKKKNANISKKEVRETDQMEDKSKKDNDENIKSKEKSKTTENQDNSLENNPDKNENLKIEEKQQTNDLSSDTLPRNTTTALPISTETPKVETERPPKFFTSVRSPRTVDIDVKCCKRNLSLNERFLSVKCETKNDVNNKEKRMNTLVSQGPESDVYTFTEKVDSPNSISEIRPMNRIHNMPNIDEKGRPVARVKGTVVNKKMDVEKKKFSPHRPIDDVVNRLMVKKLNENPNSDAESNTIFNTMSVYREPEAIVSKSYKMVARKSSVTGKPFSPLKFFDRESSPTKSKNGNEKEKTSKTNSEKKITTKAKNKHKKSSMTDDDIDTSTFALNKKTLHYSSSEDDPNESNDDKESGSETPKNKKTKTKKYKRITDSAKKSTSKELKELSKDSLIDLKDDSIYLAPGVDKPSKRRRKLLSMWTGPKKHRMASLNAIAKVHCLYENESRTHMELGLMKTVDRQPLPSTSKASTYKKKDNKSKEMDKQESTSESEYENSNKDKKDDSSESSDDSPPQRTLRGVPGIRSAGKYWDPKSSTSSSEDSELECKKKTINTDKKKSLPKTTPSVKSDSEKPPTKMKKTVGVPMKKKRIRNEVVMDLKDMVVQKRMASLNATAILAASYEKRSPKSSKDDTTSDSCSDESFCQKPKNGVSSGVKSETKNEEPKKEEDDGAMTDRKQKVEVIVNQDTDVTITGVYSTHHHEGFCTVSGMQYRISSTSHTQTTATANCEKESCSRDDGSRYTPLSALSSMKPPADQAHGHPQPVPELGGLGRRAAGCSSAFSAPSPAAHHEPGKPTMLSCTTCETMQSLPNYGYYQPAGPLIKETSADAERALARYHPPPHYHPSHPPVLQQYGPPYYPAELCYSRYYRPPGPYHMAPPQPDAQMVGVGSEPYPPQYYASPPCYQHSPQRVPYIEYRGCSCPLNPCPKNVLIGPATGKAPTGGGPADVPSAIALPGGAFRPKVRACAVDTNADTHGSGKDPPLDTEPPAAADAPHPCPLPAIGGASPKRELYDVRENLRLAADMPGPVEAVGPPSPARGSAGACAPQPPPVAPRRARLGKAMARRSLAGDDTGLLLSAPAPPQAHHSDADDDVLAISPPTCAPIDLSSSDERSTPLVDIKKENEGPTNSSQRKPDAQALREHNSTTLLTLTDTLDNNNAAKAVKRRYSKPKLEIEMKDAHLEEGCKTNCIGEHVKLQKRRKVSSEHNEVVRTETLTKDFKKKQSQKVRKTPSSDKKTPKRKLERGINGGPKAKKRLLASSIDKESRLISHTISEDVLSKPKHKSALLLDNLIRKNSIDRPDGFDVEKELNPAELFLSPNENVTHNIVKKTNINNNIVDNNVQVNGVRQNTISAVSQHIINKKIAAENASKVDSTDTKTTNKSVLKPPTEKLQLKESKTKNDFAFDKWDISAVNSDQSKVDVIKNKIDKDEQSVTSIVTNKAVEMLKTNKLLNSRALTETGKVVQAAEKSLGAVEPISEKMDNDTRKAKSITDVDKANKIVDVDGKVDRPAKRCKLTADKEMKSKNVEKVVKLLVSKKPAIKTDEATLVVEDACASPPPPTRPGRRAGRRRRSGAGGRRGRRPPAPLAPPDLEPRQSPRWSNGWNFDGEPYLAKVYLNNNSRVDRVARCWARMSHASGDGVSCGDCVLLRASAARAQPFVARVARLWENPDDGEMMVSLVWYYRPEHTELGRQPTDAPDEVFASRHRDANSVACIEDKCYVLTFNEYCRYRKRLKAAEEGVVVRPSIVPPMPAQEVNSAVATNDSRLPPTVSPELVLFCRKIYDYRTKKIQVPNK